MRKMLSVCSVAIMAVFGSGCIMVIGVERPINPEHVVVLDGEFLLVNTKKKTVRKIEVTPVEESITVQIEESNGG